MKNGLARQKSMNPAISVGTVGVALLVTAFAHADISVSTNTDAEPSVPLVFTNSIVPESPETNEIVHLPLREFNASPSPQPGVYLSEPYTCVIKVPGSHHDDLMLHPRPYHTSDMPIIRPKLKMVPPKPPQE